MSTTKTARREGDDLVRLRADPEKVRVAVQRCEEKWIATVEARRDVVVKPKRYRAASVIDSDPVEAVRLALALAESRKLPGIDLGCAWAYPHPFGVEAAQRANAGRR